MAIIRVGILGTGFGLVHTKIYQDIAGVEIAGIFGRNRDKLKQIKSDFQLPITQDPNDLIHDSSIDLIDVCLPTSTHIEYVAASLQAGRDVFCETPLAYNLQQAQKMQHLARKYKRNLWVNLFNKYSPPHRFARNLIKTKKMGQPRSITIYSRTPSFWENVGLDSIVLNFMLHNFDFLIELLGVPHSISARGIGEQKNAHVVATLNYSDSMASVDCSSLVPDGYPFSTGYNIVCPGGTIAYAGEFGDNPQEKTTIYHEDGSLEEISPPGPEANRAVLEKIYQARVNGQRCPELEIGAAIKSIKIALACNRALNSNCAIKV